MSALNFSEGRALSRHRKPPRHIAWPPGLAPATCHFIDRGLGQCAFPLWKDGASYSDKFVCGAPVVTPGAPYCAACTDRASASGAARRAALGSIHLASRVGRGLVLLED